MTMNCLPVELVLCIVSWLGDDLGAVRALECTSRRLLVVIRSRPLQLKHLRLTPQSCPVALAHLRPLPLLRTVSFLAFSSRCSPTAVSGSQDHVCLGQASFVIFERHAMRLIRALLQSQATATVSAIALNEGWIEMTAIWEMIAHYSASLETLSVIACHMPVMRDFVFIQHVLPHYQRLNLRHLTIGFCRMDPRRVRPLFWGHLFAASRSLVTLRCRFPARLKPLWMASALKRLPHDRLCYLVLACVSGGGRSASETLAELRNHHLPNMPAHLRPFPLTASSLLCVAPQSAMLIYFQ